MIACTGSLAHSSAGCECSFRTAISMMAVTALFGGALARGPLPRRFELVAPALGTLSLAFGLWYGLAALSAVPYFL
jgi:hypothetical protein